MSMLCDRWAAAVADMVVGYILVQWSILECTSRRETTSGVCSGIRQELRTTPESL